MQLESLVGKRCLLVASTGGHLAQAVKWAERLQLHDDSVFVTFRSAQSESLLAGRPVLYTGYVEPRDVKGVLRASYRIARSAELRHADAVLSTGAGLALSALPGVAIGRLPMVYIESVSRFLGPSLTGRIMARNPLVTTYTQHPLWASNKWRYAGSLLSDYVALRDEVHHGGGRPLRILVTLGTIAPYRFDRLVESVLAAIRPDDTVTWQLGTTMRSDLPGDVRSYISAEDFGSLARYVDVVVTHAGVGTLLSMLDAGIRPVVMARRADMGEHIDDHQSQVAAYLAQQGLIHLVSGALSRPILESPGRVTLRKHDA